MSAELVPAPKPGEPTPVPWSAYGPYEEGGFINSGYLITTGYDVRDPEPEVGVPDGREPLHSSLTGFRREDAQLLVTAVNYHERLQEALGYLADRVEHLCVRGTPAWMAVLAARVLLRDIKNIPPIKEHHGESRPVKVAARDQMVAPVDGGDVPGAGGGGTDPGP